MGERCRADQLTRICSADKKCTNTAQCHLTVSRACRQLSRRGPELRSDYNITIEASGGRVIFDLQLARCQYVTFATLLYWRKCNNAWKLLCALSTRYILYNNTVVTFFLRQDNVSVERKPFGVKSRLLIRPHTRDVTGLFHCTGSSSAVVDEGTV